MYTLAFAESIQLFPDGTLFIHIALILIMIWVLNRTLFRPINKVLDERERAKGGSGGAADGLISQAAEKETKYNADILDTRSKGYELIEKEQKISTDSRDKKLADVKAEVATKLESGRSEIEKQQADAHAALAANADEMADKIAAAILRS